jgi:hypothetical protein
MGLPCLLILTTPAGAFSALWRRQLLNPLKIRRNSSQFLTIIIRAAMFDIVRANLLIF